MHIAKYSAIQRRETKNQLPVDATIIDAALLVAMTLKRPE
jgi:hypothetical protein